MILAQLGQKPKAPRDIVPFRFRAIGGESLLTSEWGDWVFEKLRENDEDTVSILRRWTTVRERSHFIHASAAS